MEAFVIEGSCKLSGEVIPQGAKNEALQVLCAVLLTDQKVIMKNIPQIRDVLKLIEILGGLGVKVKKTGSNDYEFQADEIDLEFLHSAEFYQMVGSLRGSVMLMGPLLTRFGRGVMVKPGGDKIGRRRMDTHFMGFQKLGATFETDPENKFYKVSGDNLQGQYMLLDEASVTGTANIIMAAVMAKGTTTIYNAACEPYVQQLCRMLNKMGAKISGVGTNMVVVDGVEYLLGCEHACLPDMIEIGSFIGLAAMTQSDITIKDCGIEHLGIIPEMFGRLGIKMEMKGDDIHVPAQEMYEIDTYIDGSILTISDAPWPGFTPDLISIALVTAIHAHGNVLIHQKMFESRLFFIDNLLDMGAQLILCDPHRATVMGLARRNHLKGIRMTSPDIRAGVALLFAALSAKGTSTILSIEQIDRGYERIDERLNAIGAKIQRIKELYK
jgi:UDP-N-acetylglucosamine 1-carboxyvinyltransferase